MNEPTATITLTATELGYLKAGLAAHRIALGETLPMYSGVQEKIDETVALTDMLTKAQIQADADFREPRTISFDPATGVTVWRCSCGYEQSATPARYDAGAVYGYYGDSLHFCESCGECNNLY